VAVVDLKFRKLRKGQRWISAKYDTTGRCLRSDKRRAIPAHLAPILTRFDLDLTTWLDAMRSPRRFLGSAIGSVAARATESLRRGVKMGG
jgi:hypothetical protein